MKKLTVQGFKGVVTDKLPITLKPEELAFALNMDLNNDGSLSQRAGSLLVQDFTANKVNLLKFNEIREGQINELLIAIVGNTLYIYDDTTGNFISKYTNLDTSFDKWNGKGYVSNFIFSNGVFTYRLYYDESVSDYQVEIISYDYKNDGTSQTVDIAVDDIVYNADGNDVNGKNNTYYIAVIAQTGIDLSTEDFTDTTKWSELGDKSIIPSGLYFEQFDNRIFIAGDGTENLYFSNQGDPTEWDATDFIAMGANITSLKAVGEYLFVGTDRGLYKVSLTGDATIPYQVTQITEDNILNNSLTEVNAGIVGALTKSGRFIVFNQYAKQGSEVMYQIGLPIRNVITTITDNDLNTLRYKNKLIITCNVDFSYIPAGNTQNNAQLVLNNVIYGWTFYDLPIYNLQEYKDVIFYSDYSGKVFKFDEDTYQDNGNEFDVYAITSIFLDKEFDVFKNFRRVFLIANPKTRTTIRLYWNLLFNIKFSDNRNEDKEIYAAGGYWGEATWGDFIWGGTYAEIPTFRIDSTGRGIQLKIKRQSENSDLKIQGYVIEYQPTYIKGTNY